jgi:hypothetical protein
MFPLRRALALGFALAFLACEPVAAPDPEFSPNFNARGNPVVGSARGSGSVDNSIRTFPSLRYSTPMERFAGPGSGSRSSPELCVKAEEAPRYQHQAA